MVSNGVRTLEIFRSTCFTGPEVDSRAPPIKRHKGLGREKGGREKRQGEREGDKEGN